MSDPSICSTGQVSGNCYPSTLVIKSGCVFCSIQIILFYTPYWMICLTGKKINEPSFRIWHFLMLLVRNILFWTMRPTILYNQWFMNYSADECAFRYCIFLLIINIPFKFDRGIVSYSLRFWGLERWSDSVERTLKFTALTSKRYWIPSVLSIDLRLRFNPCHCVRYCKTKVEAT